MKYTFKDLQGMQRIKQAGENFAFDLKTQDYEYLDLSRNEDFKVITFEAPQPKLRYLDISHCKIEKIVFSYPLPNLETLYLHHNKLQKIEFKIELPKLELIDLSFNEKLSDVIIETDLKSLNYLYLHQCNLKDIQPLTKYFIKEGFDFNIEKNENLSSPPVEIVNQGKKAVINYFQSLQIGGEDYIYEARILILGEAGAGKTTLARKLQDPNAEMPEEKDTTKGIDVFRWGYDVDTSGGNRLMRVNLWDFGGQSIYKSTHRFFLSHRALYVLLTDGRKEDTDFNYWLNLAEMFGGESPVVIITNIKEKREYTIPLNTLQSRFGNVKEAAKLDLKNIDHNYDKLLKTLKYQISQLPHIGSKLPKSWADIRKDIEGLKEKFISHQRFFEICEKNGVHELEKILQISQFFHDIGVFLHFQDHPQLGKILFLKNEWALDAAYAILDDLQIKNQNGHFTKADAIKIWGKDYFLVYDDLLALMMRFYLVYEVDGSQKFIAPQLLLNDKPPYDWNESENLQLRYDYDDFMPQGILWQFIATMHKKIKDNSMVWRSGVVISEGLTDAEITEVYGKHKINIRIRGKNKSELRTIIAYELDNINQQYAKLKYEKLVPCCCHECKGVAEPYFYKYTDLQRRKEKGIKKVQCEKSYEEVDVMQLLEGIEVPAALKSFLDLERTGNTILPEKRKIRIFVSYSSLDKVLHDLLVEGIKKHLHQSIDYDFEFWTDKQIDLGSDWKKEINSALDNNEVALLLVSANFAASEFINTVELAEFFKKKKEENYLIMPVLVREYDFVQFELLASIQFFKTSYRDYGFNKPTERDKFLPFDKLAENEETTDENLNKYYKNLADFIRNAVAKKYR